MSIIGEWNGCIKSAIQKPLAGEDRDHDGLKELVTDTVSYCDPVILPLPSQVTYSWGEIDGKSAWISKNHNRR